MIMDLDKSLANYFQANFLNSRKRDGIWRQYDSSANKFTAERVI